MSDRAWGWNSEPWPLTASTLGPFKTSPTRWEPHSREVARLATAATNAVLRDAYALGERDELWSGPAFADSRGL